MRNPWTGSLGRPAKHRQPNNFNLDNQNVGELINFWSKQKRKLLTAPKILTTKGFGDNFLTMVTDSMLIDKCVVNSMLVSFLETSTNNTICQQHRIINIFQNSLHP